MKQKMDSVQALRALAFFCVFLNHCYVKTNGWPISVFIMLSGFLLVISRLPKPDDFTPNVVKNIRSGYSKVKSLYHLYILTMLPIVLLELLSIYKGTSSSSYGSLVFEIIISALMVQAWFPGHSMALNGVSWYLSAMVFLYFAFPYILRLLRKYRRISTAVLVMAGLFVLEFVLSAAEPVIYSLTSGFGTDLDSDGFALWFTFIFPLFRLIDFALGCNLGYIFLRLRDREHSKGIVWGLDIVIALLFAVTSVLFKSTGYFFSREEYRHTFIFAPIALAIVYSFALAKGPLSRLLTNKITVFFGNLSNYTYLIHQDVIRYFMLILTYLGISLDVFRITVIPVALALTVLLALGYKKLAESRRKTMHNA